jgi:hypothetical protein
MNPKVDDIAKLTDLSVCVPPVKLDPNRTLESSESWPNLLEFDNLPSSPNHRYFGSNEHSKEMTVNTADPRGNRPFHCPQIPDKLSRIEEQLIHNDDSSFVTSGD